MKIWLKYVKNVFLLIMITLFVSCKGSVDSNQSETKQNFGAVCINFSGGNERTVLPSEIDISKLFYKLEFTKADNSESIFETQNGAESCTFELSVGTWDLEIKGFYSENDASDSSKALVSYSQTGITISYGNNVTINAKLIPYLENLTQNGSGSLRYNIHFPEGTAGVLKIFNYPDKQLVGEPIVFSTTENCGSVELLSGYYDLSVSYEYQGKVKIWSEIIHIYDNAITEISITSDDFTDFLPPPGPVDVYLSMDKFTMTDEGEGVFDGIEGLTLDKTISDISTIAVDNLVAVEWRVNNTVLGAGDRITLDASTLPLGTYTLSVSFLKNGKYWSSSIKFEVAIVTGNLPADYYELITPSNNSDWRCGCEELIGTYRIVKGTSQLPSEIYIPAYYEGVPVTEIGTTCVWDDDYDKAPFLGNSNITAIHIAEGIRNIGTYAFYGCQNLTNIIIPEGVIDISSLVFQYCTSLISITFPASVQYIGPTNMAIFYGCPNLKEIVVNENNKNYSSEGIILYNKDKTTIIDYSLAKGCVVIPEGITSIGPAAFYGATDLTSITFPSTLTDLNDGSWHSDIFSGCTGLTSVTIPTGMTTIANYMFAHCTNLTSITISETVTDIVWGAFYDCNNLTNIIIDERNPNYLSEDGIIYNKEKTELLFYPSARGEVIIPSNVTTIADSACYGANKLINLIISEGVTSIESDSFANCNQLSSVIIPSSVTHIGHGAFDSYNLTCVTFNGIIDEQKFEEGGGGSHVTFPGDLREKYLAPDGGIGTYIRSDSYSDVWTKL